VGWYIDEYDRAQVSINLVDTDQTAPHEAFDVIDEEARRRGLRVTGSELVGLLPLDAMLTAGKHYLARQGKSLGIPERQIVETAIQSLGLREISAFDPDEKIIEYRLKRGKKRLVSRTVSGFADLLSTETPAPGGGSVSALCGALSAALSAMVANLTHGRKGQDDAWDRMSELASAAQERKEWLLGAVDRDTDAFDQMMAAMRIKATTDDEKTAKAKAVREASRTATQVPLEVLQSVAILLDLAGEVAASGNPNALSDAGVAVWCARTCAEGAHFNVLINLTGIDGDDDWVRTTSTAAAELIRAVRTTSDQLAASIEDHLRAG